MLDEQDGELEVVTDPANRLAERADLLVVETCGRLVQQQQARPRRQRARELYPLQRPERQARSRTLGEMRQADVLERLVGLGARTPLLEVPRPGVRAHEDVVEHRHRPKEHDVLEGADDSDGGDAVCGLTQQVGSVEDDAPGIRVVEPRDDVERGRLARSVRADQPCDLALVGGERNGVQSDETAEPQRHVLDGKQRHGRVASLE